MTETSTLTLDERSKNKNTDPTNSFANPHHQYTNAIPKAALIVTTIPLDTAIV